MDFSPALQTFRDESNGLLQTMESILLQAEECSPEVEDAHSLFRAAHTIKGSAGMFSFDLVVVFTHEVETLLDRIRNQELELTGDLASLLLESCDHIADLLASYFEHKDEFPDSSVLRARLLSVLNVDDSGSSADIPSGISVPAPNGEVCRDEPSEANDCWHISLRFDPDLLCSGLDPLSMIQFLSTLGELVHVETLDFHLPDIFSLDAEKYYLGFEVALISSASKQDIEDVFEFVWDMGKITILPPRSCLSDYIALIESSNEERLRLGEMLITCGSITEAELRKALEAQQVNDIDIPVGEVLVEQNSLAPPVLDAAIKKQKKNEEKLADQLRQVKVSADRLDQLIDQVGELVIASSAAQLQARQLHDSDMLEAAENQLRLVEEVRDSALRLRMIPIGEIFGRFPRVVRDMAKDIDKNVRLKIIGAETELDKSMVDKISDPLMHLIRNSIDHGIETEEERVALGKPAKGHLCLNAYHSSGGIVIEVSDDGRGLDAEKILAKAVEKKLVSSEADLTVEDIHRLILAPGFSTASAVTNLSGRGVGMDVVKSNVEALRGVMDIESCPGQGTTMRLCLPLTLAIIDGFQVKVGSTVFILPLDVVEECVELPRKSNEHDYFNLRDEVLPVLRLRRKFSIAGREPERENIVVVNFAGRKVGVMVDHLLGECQTVIKPLGPLFAQLSGFSGSTILGTGEVALILDVAQLIRQEIDGAHFSMTIPPTRTDDL